MRHTRNRQLYRLTKDKHCAYNVTIEFNNKWTPLGLDPTFKWNREYGREFTPWGYNFIEFQGKLRLVKF